MMWAPKGLGSPAPYSFSCSSPCIVFPGLTLYTASDCSWQMFHVSDISNLPGPGPSQFHELPCHGLLPGNLTLLHIAWPTQVFLWSLGGSLYDPATLGFCKRTQPTPCGWQPSVNHQLKWYSGSFRYTVVVTSWVLGQLNPVMTSLVWSEHISCTPLLRESLSNKFILLHCWPCDGWELTDSWGAHLSNCRGAKDLVSF
jgi:hypothetical protein